MKQIKTWTTFLLLAGAMMKHPPGFAQKMVSDSVTASPQLPNARPMIAVIFEVVVAEGHQQEYLDIAKRLLPQLKEVDGFISIERFQSLHTPGKILSLSFWRDEESVKHWRNTEEHRWAQEKGRQGVFRDYRLRVVGVIRDYGMFDREQAPDDSKVRHDNLKN